MNGKMLLNHELFSLFFTALTERNNMVPNFLYIQTIITIGQHFNELHIHCHTVLCITKPLNWQLWSLPNCIRTNVCIFKME